MFVVNNAQLVDADADGDAVEACVIAPTLFTTYPAALIRYLRLQMATAYLLVR